MECPSCNGAGKLCAHFNTGRDSSKHYFGYYKCFRCSGAGSLNDEWVSKGEAARLERRMRKLTLLEAANKLGVSPSTLSSMEAGKIEPAVSYEKDNNQ